MKQLVFFFLVCAFPSILVAQKAQLKVYANSAEQIGEVEVSEFRRITFLIDDGAPRDGSVVYEYGPIQIFRVNDAGERTPAGTFKEAEVVNSPTLNFGLSPQQNPDLMGHIELEVEWVKRYNLDKSTDVLEFEPGGRTIPFHLHKK